MADSTAARQIGTCVKCGGALYEYLVHHCSTSGLTTHSLAGQSAFTDGWVYTSEPATPLYIGPLPFNVRRMLVCLDAYWRCHDGRPGRRGRYDLEDWWTRFEKYRRLVEADL